MDSSSPLGSGSSSTFGNCASSHNHSSGCPSAEMVFLLENQVSFLREQMSVLVVEMGLTHQWIRNNFGAQIQIVNTDSSFYKILHGHDGPNLEMMEAIQKSLEVTEVTDDEATQATVRGTSNAEESTSTPTVTTDGEENNGRARKEARTATKVKQVKGTTNNGHGQFTTPAKAIIATPKQTSSVASTSRNTSSGRTPQSAAGVKQLFQCRHCFLHISNPSALIKHEATHTGGKKKPFQCRFCDDTFHQKAPQLSHERRRHTGEKPFKCGVTDCSKTFAKIGDQKSHERSHTDGKPFACQYCDKKFARSTNLCIHIRTHTGEKPFICQHPDCRAAFHYAGALQEHRRKIHPIPPTDQHSSLIN